MVVEKVVVEDLGPKHAEMEKQILESLDEELVRPERWRPVQPNQ